MDSLSVLYDRGTVPTILVALETFNGRTLAAGDIDSGSDRTLIPVEFLGELGLKTSDLKKTQTRGLAASGGQFDTWSTPGIAVTGQIEVTAGSGFRPWGPVFKLRPYFADTESLLLGQLDFFAAFDVHFVNATSGPIFELCPRVQQIKGP